MVTIKELPEKELLAPGHRLCAGCSASIAARMALKAIRGPTVVVQSTGCLEVATTIYPYSSWEIPWVHVAFENAAAVASGIEAAFKAMKKKGVDIITLCGDGGTFDIGIQALSGALERGHDFVYICYTNEAYMNTGIQRSGATPRGAWTTTTPAGTVIPGKPEFKKDLIGICASHGIEYAATACISYWNDYMTKVRKAIEVDGPAVIDVLAPCPRGWRFDPSKTIEMGRLAVQTRYFPIYEVDKGEYRLNMKVQNPKPVEEFLKAQGRFSHLFKPEFVKEVEVIQGWVDKNWERITRFCGEV